MSRAASWGGAGGTPGGGTPWSGPAQPAPAPPAAHAPYAHVKAEPEPLHQKRDKSRRDGGGAGGDKEKFLSQPMHAYVSGRDVASAPEGETFTPPCCCGSWGNPGYHPGPHTTWDCPLRYIQRYGSCPGFHTNAFGIHRSGYLITP